MRRLDLARSALDPRRTPGRLPARLGAAAFAAALCAGCGARPFAEGSSRELVVITSLPPDSPEVLLLKAIVEREVVRIDHETAYVVRLARPEDGRAYRSTNVLLVGTGSLNRIPPDAGSLRDILERAGRPYAFIGDLWLRGQAAGILWAASRASWLTELARIQNRFFLELDRATFAAVRERVLSLPRDRVAERFLADSLGYTLQVPRGYAVHIDRRARAALLLEAGPPARLLRIRAVTPSDERADTGLGATRDALARLFRPDERTLDFTDPTLVPDEMAGAVRRLHGRWEDARVSAAGPFRYYEIARGSRRYEVDLSVFAPGKPKLPYLRELSAIAESLTPR